MCFLIDFYCNIITYSIYDAIFKCNFSVCLGHGIITSLVIVFTGFLINKENKTVPFISRFLFMFILLGAPSALSDGNYIMAALVCLTV